MVRRQRVFYMGCVFLDRAMLCASHLTFYRRVPNARRHYEQWTFYYLLLAAECGEI